jgi:hypothetical protein
MDTNLSEKVSAFSFRVTLNSEELIPLTLWHPPEVSHQKIVVFETSIYILFVT